MEENKNMALTDEKMQNVAGGKTMPDGRYYEERARIVREIFENPYPELNFAEHDIWDDCQRDGCGVYMIQKENYDLNYATGQKGVFKPGDIVGIMSIRSYYTNDIVGRIE